MSYNLETYFLLFMTYSILGWVMESVKMIFNKNVGHFVNRGFLLGPYLPIYRFWSCCNPITSWQISK